MKLDYPTVLFFFVLTNVFNIALFTYQYFFHHKKWYLSVFITGILFQTIAMVLIGNRNSLPFLFSVQISNFFFITSFALTSFGLLSFDGVVRKNLLYLFAVFSLLFYISFLLVAENDVNRIIIQIIACSFFYGMSAFSLFTNKRRYKFSMIIGVALLVYSVFQLYRASIIYHIDQPYSFLKGSIIDNWYLMVSLFIVSTLRIGFIMLLMEIDKNTILLKNTRIQADKIKLQELNTTKDKLFSIIAHDLRSPFNGILGFSDLLLRDAKCIEKEKTEKYLSIINSSAQNTLVLLDNLLHWAKSQTGQISFHPKEINLSSTLHDIVQLSNSAALAKDISLSKNNDDEIMVFTDGDMLRIVLRNLISNAIKFSHPGGHIRTTAKEERGKVVISVEDNGVGMPENTVAKLFKIETNETCKGTANEKGSGLGLVLCKELVEKQGGQLWVESELGKGSIFRFSLPSYN